MTTYDDEQDAIHGDLQCQACGDWLPVTGTTERPCPCGLVKDVFASTHALGVQTRQIESYAKGATFAQAVILRHNLTVVASMAEEAAQAINERLRSSTECAHCSERLVHVYPDNWEHQSSGSQWCLGGMRERAVPVLP